MKRYLIFLVGILSILAASALNDAANNQSNNIDEAEEHPFVHITEPSDLGIESNLFEKTYSDIADSLALVNPDRYSHLTENDFRKVADELGVEEAAIKAVVQIEAGAAMKGFWAPGVPVINFDATMYAKYKNKVADKSGAKGESVPKGLTGYALKEYKQFINARKTNAQGACMGTFWGMFQIGGFNYKLCGCDDVNEFVRLMAYSEAEQLELFAIFLENTGMVEPLRKKDWATFARRYNGPSYAKRGYHTKMANAYKKFIEN